MKVLFITDNFPPEVNAPATRTFEHCTEWLKHGVDLTVLTCAPNFPQGKVYSGYRNSLVRREKLEGIHVIRVWSYITRNEGFLKRIVDYLSFAFSAFLAGLFIDADIIVATSPQFFTTFAAFGLSKVKRKPWVFELRDLWPESIKTVGAMRDSWILRALEKVELFLYKDASLVVSLTGAFKRKLISRGIAAGKIKVVSNGSNLETFRPREKDPELTNKLDLNGKFVVGYMGTHGMAHGLDFIVRSLGHLIDERIHFLFIGDGARKKSVAALAQHIKLSNVTFLDPVPRELVPRYLSLLDAALVPLKKADTFRTVIPSKIFEAVAMRKPILLGVEGQAQELIEQYHAGVCFEPENREDFLEKLFLIKRDRGLYRSLQDGCARLAGDYERKRLAQAMLGHLSAVVETRSGLGLELGKAAK